MGDGVDEHKYISAYDEWITKHEQCEDSQSDYMHLDYVNIQIHNLRRKVKHGGPRGLHVLILEDVKSSSRSPLTDPPTDSEINPLLQRRCNLPFSVCASN